MTGKHGPSSPARVGLGRTGLVIQGIGGGSVAKVPSRFEFTLLPGHELIREEIAGRSEADHSVTYRTIGQALSLVDDVATYRLKPITNEGKKRCFVEWSRS